MAEGLVRLSHLVCVFLTLYRRAYVVGGVHQLVGELLRHRLAGSDAGVADDPATGQGGTPVRSDLDRDLVCGATDSLGLHLQEGGGVAQGVLEGLQRVAAAGSLLDDVEGVVDDPLRRALLAAQHHAVDEFSHAPVRVHRVRSNDSPLDPCSSWHQAVVTPSSRAWRRTWSGPGSGSWRPRCRASLG